jgi:SAM-dependent methyltransferase
LYDGHHCFAPELAFESDGFDSEAHKRLFQLEQRCFWFRARNKLLQFTLEKFFPWAQSLFEIGCGTGFVLAGFADVYPEMRLVGGEIYVSVLKHASSRVPRCEFIQVDVCNLPYENEFDVIGAFDLLEHIDEDERAIKQMHQALKGRGCLILTVPQHQWLWSAQDKIARHKRRYSRKALVNKIEFVGFQVIWVTSFISLLLPLMVVSRLRWRWIGSTRVSLDNTVEFQLPERFDFLLEKACDVERRFLEKHGQSLPLGGSLLVVAMKG